MEHVSGGQLTDKMVRIMNYELSSFIWDPNMVFGATSC